MVALHILQKWSVMAEATQDADEPQMQLHLILAANTVEQVVAASGYQLLAARSRRTKSKAKIIGTFLNMPNTSMQLRSSRREGPPQVKCIVAEAHYSLEKNLSLSDVF